MSKLRLHDRQDKPRMYEKLWDLIAKNTSDSPVKVSAPLGNHARIIQAVRKEKARANMARKNVDAVCFGDLIVTENGRDIFFSLDFNGDMI